MRAAGVNKSAILSACGTYRYQLVREWDNDLPTCAFIMLNPSTADAERDDNTIKKCVKFAQRWGFGCLLVGNLYAYRATDPAALNNRGIDVVGRDNDGALRHIVRVSDRIVCAWGANCPDTWRAPFVRNTLLAGNPDVYALRVTKDGHPGHPLYIRDDTKPIPF